MHRKILPDQAVGPILYLLLVSLAAAGAGFTLWRIGEPSGPLAALAYLYMLTPAVACVVTRFTRKEGFADAGLRLGTRRWYAVGCVFPVSVHELPREAAVS